MYAGDDAEQDFELAFYESSDAVALTWDGVVHWFRSADGAAWDVVSGWLDAAVENGR